MEASSPLAAMHPPSMHWDSQDIFGPRRPSRFPYSQNIAQGRFNFNNMVTKPAAPGYFQLDSIQGSSPTTSLAVDLSENFHINKSPIAATPRRSLFTSNSMFGKLANKEKKETITTPPLLSSSPCGGYYESMDISPLPHKAPFSTQIEVHSPSPTPAGEIDNPLASSPPFKSSEASSTTSLAPPERKKWPTRPGVSRFKALSSSNIPKRQETQLPQFRFGAGSTNGSSKLSTNSMSLDECFGNSPPAGKENERQRGTSLDLQRFAPVGPPPKFKQSLSISVVRNGSPIGQERRRPQNPLLRPRKQFRRASSMFESAEDVMMPNKNPIVPTCSALQSVMDIDDVHRPVLPHFYPDGQPDNIPRITRETLIEILDGKYDENYNKKMVIDCRFEYEFNGGHIDGAYNYNDKDLLADELFETQTPGKTLLVFHCEYSAHRAPMMARHIRQQDRTANIEHYPRLTYPEVYILEGGYSGFFTAHRERCEPQNYVEMDDKNHAYTCEREMGKLRQNRAKFSRAQTFAFGQGLQDSPTAPSRCGRGPMDTMMMMDSSPISSDNRMNARRMASY